MLRIKARGILGNKTRLRGRILTGLSVFFLLALSFAFTLQTVHQAHASSQQWTAPGSGEIKLETAINSECALVAEQAYCWGIGVYPGTRTPVPMDSTPGYEVFANKSVTDMSTGETNCAVADGNAYCWGDNGQGQIGDGTTTRSNVPVAVDTSGVLAGKTVTKISTGTYSQWSSTCAVASGAVYCWGNNDNGQLGDGTTNDSAVPIAVDTSGVLAGKTVVDVVRGGMYHTCALTSDGKVFCWGKVIQGPFLGDGTTNGSAVPVAVDTSGVLAGKTVVSIATGWQHTCALTSDGQVACWGDGNGGQLGNGGGSSVEPTLIDTSGVLAGKTITSLSATGNVTCAAADGGGYCWGYPYNQSLGDSAHSTQSNIPVAVDLTNLSVGETVDSVSAGMYTQCLSTSRAHVYCWGSNSTGQLGNGDYSDSAIPVQTNSLTPEFVSVTPDTILVDQSGISVNITEKDAVTGARVWFGSQEATVTSQSGDTLTVTVPESSTIGSVDITITNPGGETVTAPNAFTYSLLTPQIDSTYPEQGESLLGGGGNYYLYGFNFDPAAVVRFGTVEAQIQYISSTFIQVKVPAVSHAGSVPVTVTNPNGAVGTAPNQFVYVASSYLDNKYLKQFGSTGTGNGQFDWLEGVTTDSDGNVYVTDNGNSRVQVFDKNGNYLRQFGSAGAGDGQFDYPTAIKIGPDDNVYVLDTNNYRVEVFSKSGIYLRQIDVSEAGYSEGMALNSKGDMYITDCGTHSSVKVYASNGSYLRSLGDDGAGNGQFDCSYAVAIDKNDSVYIADARNYRIQVFDKHDNFIRKFGSQGIGQGKFDWIEDLTVDVSGNILVVDSGNNRIQVFSKTGAYLGQIGKFGTGNGEFDWPNSIAIGQDGNLYITDQGHYRIEIFEGMKPTSTSGNNDNGNSDNPDPNFSQGDGNIGTTDGNETGDESGDKPSKHTTDKDTKKDESKNDSNNNNNSSDQPTDNEKPKTFFQKIADFVAKHPVAAVATAAATVVVSSSAIWWLIVLLKP